MTVKQRIALVATAVLVCAVVIFFVWYMQRPKVAPDGVLVYREAYMQIADRPWQGERLCLNN